MLKFIKRIIPPHKWKLPVTFALAIFIGFYSYAIYLSNAGAYLSDNPETCINCHVMVPQYVTWNHGSHGEVASCNDCHVPHNNIFNTYYFKAKDGIRHATIFTLRKEPQVIRIKEEGIRVVQENCIRCHNNLLLTSQQQINNSAFHSNTESRLCWECHRETPHGRVKGLSTVPDAIVPLLESPVPEWIKNITNE